MNIKVCISLSGSNVYLCLCEELKIKMWVENSYSFHSNMSNFHWQWGRQGAKCKIMCIISLKSTAHKPFHHPSTQPQGLPQRPREILKLLLPGARKVGEEDAYSPFIELLRPISSPVITYNLAYLPSPDFAVGRSQSGVGLEAKSPIPVEVLRPRSIDQMRGVSFSILLNSTPFIK